ncbi:MULTISPECIES: hypothetical protein [unclassified Nocardiopsis]|uniref:hypothetical protein n=1 Tax=unclassified Nocardiopsis TaxID=2649073 RepID=UPI001356F048|nr:MULTISPECIES: hypothetical protein [unclassified Nocardiopsis]
MFNETVAVDRNHLTALLGTLARTAPTPPPLPAALQELANALHGQDPDGTTWLVPAEALWTALHYANALDTYDLDETDSASYTHPALRAEEHVQRQLLAQAPRTDAAMEALAEAELVLLQAERELHASYLYGNAHITERRCLTCEVTYPCPPARALGLGEAP